MTGTSVAAPHLAGAAALLAQQHHDWEDNRIKHALTSSARTLATREHSTRARGT
ncbi:S8 family serine peptidase [Streptomyces sp. NPDC057675]|uniref:S8 family serine peptidase n=1 Tax=Streptomyces sp. NPDC057675 TaxID=3346204 RepID=UPI003689332D